MRHIGQEYALHAAGRLRVTILLFELDVLLPESLFRAQLLTPQLVFLQGALYRWSQSHNAVLKEVVRRALFHAFNDLVLADGAGKDDERDHLAGLLQYFQGTQVVESSQRIIGKNNVRLLLEPGRQVCLGLHALATRSKAETN